MTTHSGKWQQYYAEALARPHAQRTVAAVEHNHTGQKIAIDCGCGTGSDSQFLAEQGYSVHAFDINADAIALCKTRFAEQDDHSPNDKRFNIRVSQASFESFRYPPCSIIIANNSLFFAEPSTFAITWQRMTACLVSGGIFAGDFMGINDSWAHDYPTPISAFSRSQVEALLEGFDILTFHERDELGKTMIGHEKHWHIFSVMAIKR